MALLPRWVSSCDLNKRTWLFLVGFPGTVLGEIDALCDLETPSDKDRARLIELMVSYNLSSNDLSSRFTARRGQKLSQPDHFVQNFG